jgi:hypothetical protein
VRSSHDGCAALARALRSHGGTVAGLVGPSAPVSPRVQGPGGAGRVGFAASEAQGIGSEAQGIAPGIAAPGGARPGPPQIAAAGPRAAGREAEYELLLEMICEGSLLHYGTPRVVVTEDPDLALLIGDQLYALGLSRLAELGDLAAVAELADVISLVAQAQADGDRALADAVWAAGAAAVGWGPSEEHGAAKGLARAGDPGARAALLAIASRRGSRRPTRR